MMKDVVKCVYRTHQHLQPCFEGLILSQCYSAEEIKLTKMVSFISFMSRLNEVCFTMINKDIKLVLVR